jgi:hypothetical protein
MPMTHPQQNIMLNIYNPSRTDSNINRRSMRAPIAAVVSVLPVSVSNQQQLQLASGDMALPAAAKAIGLQ